MTAQLLVVQDAAPIPHMPKCPTCYRIFMRRKWACLTNAQGCCHSSRTHAKDRLDHQSRKSYQSTMDELRRVAHTFLLQCRGEMCFERFSRSSALLHSPECSAPNRPTPPFPAA